MSLYPSIFLAILSYLILVQGLDVVTTPDELALLSLPKKIAKCHAKNRKENVDVLLHIHYVEVNPSASTTLIMVHGWPGLWSNWLHQIYALQNDYHIIALDQRGFGSSTHPGDVQSSGTMADLVGDLVCVLNDAGVDSAICVGHDWGAQVCWEAGRLRPDVFKAIAAAVVPYMSAAGPFTPIKDFVTLLPRLGYQIYFSERTREAIAELNGDIRRSLRSVYRSVSDPPPNEFLLSTISLLEAYGTNQEINNIPYMSTEEENYLVEQYSIQGFENSLEFYTHDNRLLYWKLAHTQGNYTITQPALAIYPTEDPVADWVLVSKMLQIEKYVPNLVVETISAAHWVQLERPGEFNEALKKWLNGLPNLARSTEDKEWGHIEDEL